jgi:hypothetical protein
MAHALHLQQTLLVRKTGQRLFARGLQAKINDRTAKKGIWKVDIDKPRWYELKNSYN